MELTATQIAELQAIQQKLNNGFVLVEEKELNSIIESQANLLIFARKLQPVFKALPAGLGMHNIMQVVPQLIPIVQGLDVKQEFEKIAHLLEEAQK